MGILSWIGGSAKTAAEQELKKQANQPDESAPIESTHPLDIERNAVDKALRQAGLKVPTRRVGQQTPKQRRGR